ncbi:MAG: hypothetical protein CL678_14515 [Bdellovibrionaceae bacterium]|nr:hypothetical protein [Pseudobdellovibrionaceae bacterium]
MNATGRYTLLEPWVADSSTIYSCKAIRSFDDIYKTGVDVFKSYYEPLGLTREDVEEGRQAGANIVTLMSRSVGLANEQVGVIYVPDTHIVSYPDMSSYRYNHVVLSISLGAIPDYIQLDLLKDEMVAAASDVIGVESEVKVHVAESSGSVTPEEHDVWVAAREQAIANRGSEYGRILELQQQLQALQVKYDTLEQYVLDNDL